MTEENVKISKEKQQNDLIQATLSKLKRREHGKGEQYTIKDEKESKIILENGKYGYISAGRNPRSEEDKKLTDEEIKKRIEALQAELIERGYIFSRILAKYGGMHFSRNYIRCGQE